MRVTQSLLRNLQQTPLAVATTCAGRTRTWSQFTDRVARLAGALQAQGLTPGDRVGLLALNSDTYLDVLYATPWAGGIVVPINTRWAAAEIAYALHDAGVRLLCVDAGFRELARELRAEMGPDLGLIVLDGESDSSDCLSVETLIAQHAPVPEAGRAGDDISGIFYTGGTTGRSKGVMLSHTNHVTNSLQLAAAMRLPSDLVYLHAAPMFHIADALCIYMVTLLGGTHVVLPRFEPATVADAIDSHGVTDILLVPTMIQMLLDHLDTNPTPLASLQRLYYGASPIPEATLFRLFDRLPYCTPTQLYGQTEAAPMITVLDGSYHVRSGPRAGRLRAAGRAISCVEVRIVDEADNEVPRGTVGEVVARGPNIMRGYWGMEAQTAETLRGGWLHTGDAAWMDDEGFIYISDRLKDMIISGGENVYSTEVENAVAQCPGVAQCAVIGVPDERWGERVHAVVVPRPGATVTAEAVIAHCRALIADFKCPRSVELRDALPLSGAGKVLKTELRKPYWGERSRNVN
jgi:acyl-CoA synthetase (AMP-forming)/AMP-acid ligase II